MNEVESADQFLNKQCSTTNSEGPDGSKYTEQHVNGNSGVVASDFSASEKAYCCDDNDAKSYSELDSSPESKRTVKSSGIADCDPENSNESPATAGVDSSDNVVPSTSDDVRRQIPEAKAESEKEGEISESGNIDDDDDDFGNFADFTTAEPSHDVSERVSEPSNAECGTGYCNSDASDSNGDAQGDRREDIDGGFSGGGGDDTSTDMRVRGNGAWNAFGDSTLQVKAATGDDDDWASFETCGSAFVETAAAGSVQPSCDVPSLSTAPDYQVAISSVDFFASLSDVDCTGSSASRDSLGSAVDADDGGSPVVETDDTLADLLRVDAVELKPKEEGVVEEILNFVSIWRQLRTVEEAVALKHRWKNSRLQECHLQALGINPIANSLAFEPAEFDWASSGLQNPLSQGGIGLLDLDHLELTERGTLASVDLSHPALKKDLASLGLDADSPIRTLSTASSSRKSESLRSHSDVSPRDKATTPASVILSEFSNSKKLPPRDYGAPDFSEAHRGGSSPEGCASRTGGNGPEIATVCGQLPDLSFMLSPVLMFPVDER